MENQYLTLLLFEEVLSSVGSVEVFLKGQKSPFYLVQRTENYVQDTIVLVKQEFSGPDALNIYKTSNNKKL